ncbi:MAG: cytochrome P450 [Proteobacteria bacterium]|nr:cytochrome P450 [Pseudomonadota bacterium]
MASSPVVPARRQPAGLPLPPLVQILLWAFAPIALLRWCERRYGSTFVLRLPGVHFTMTSDPELIRLAFAAPPSAYEVRDSNKILRPLVGDHSLLLLEGQAHLRERRLMTPPFHGERMQVHGAVMVDATEAVMARWPRHERFSLHAAMQEITLEIILRAVFGIDAEGKLERLREITPRLLDTLASPWSLIIGATGEIVVPWALRPFERWLPARPFEEARAALDEAILDEITRRRTTGERGDDVLSMLIDARDESGQPMSDIELRDEMVTLLVAGHETSANTLSWAFCHLLSNPETLARLKVELDEGVGDARITPAHLPNLPYLEAVLKETLRLTPILPLVGRHLRVDLQTADTVVPAGTTLAPCVYLAHHRADQWEHPERFEPERFLEGRIAPHAWFPFGGGARRCLGMAFSMLEMRLILATIVRGASLRLAPGYRPRLTRRSITFTPSKGVPVVCS